MNLKTKLQNTGIAADSVPLSLAGRLAIEAVSPEIDAGAWPIKSALGSAIEVSADIFSDGHDVLACDLLWRREEDLHWLREPMRQQGNDRWIAYFTPQQIGRFKYTIEAWRDPFATCVADVIKKIACGQSVDLELLEATFFLERTDGNEPKALLHELRTKTKGDTEAQIKLLTSTETLAMMRASGPREDISGYGRILNAIIDRQRASFSAWYEMFPRSAANDANRHGNFSDVVARLDYVRDLGFDVLYFPPIHPIGKTKRKGRDNSLNAAPDDPGSVYAIGSAYGGHDAIHPELGTIDDFRHLVTESAARGIEIALDLAIQCSPDHPWITQRPDWFSWRPDGSLRFAENPPKKYEDIVSIKFDGAGLPDIWHAWREVILFWIDNGVRIFRVDNPHTKPLPFWRWLIADINQSHPEAIFLAEAFTRPKMMKRLAKIGFQQSYTYFTWRNTKSEIIDYMNELSGSMSAYYRPNFFTNTPDINPFYLQKYGRAGFIVRATLAATLSPSWGIYSGFELCESQAIDGREEYSESEKYQLRARDYNATNHIKDHISKLNIIRNSRDVLKNLSGLLFLNAWNDNVIAYVRMTDDRSDAILVIANLDPNLTHECVYEVPLWEFALSDFDSIEVEDLLLGGRFRLSGKTHEISLDPIHNPVVIWRLINPAFSRSAP